MRIVCSNLLNSNDRKKTIRLIDLTLEKSTSFIHKTNVNGIFKQSNLFGGFVFLFPFHQCVEWVSSIGWFSFLLFFAVLLTIAVKKNENIKKTKKKKTKWNVLNKFKKIHLHNSLHTVEHFIEIIIFIVIITSTLCCLA